MTCEIFVFFTNFFSNKKIVRRFVKNNLNADWMHHFQFQKSKTRTGKNPRKKGKINILPLWPLDPRTQWAKIFAFSGLRCIPVSENFRRVQRGGAFICAACMCARVCVRVRMHVRAQGWVGEDVRAWVRACLPAWNVLCIDYFAHIFSVVSVSTAETRKMQTTSTEKSPSTPSPAEIGSPSTPVLKAASTTSKR